MFKNIFKLLILIIFLLVNPSLSDAYMSIKVNWNWYPVASASSYYWFPYTSTYVPIGYASYRPPLLYPPVVRYYRDPLPHLIALGEAKKEAYFQSKKQPPVSSSAELKEIPPLKVPEEFQ